MRTVRNKSGLIILTLVLLAALAVIGVGCASYAKTSTVTIHVTGKESVSTKDSHEYRVYALEDTYVIKDSYLHPRFNSANLYGRIPVPSSGPGDPAKAKPLKCEVYGWRIGIFSQFKNILNCEGI